jgi:hypothetical protein
MLSNVRRLISRTRTKRNNKSQRLSRKTLIQEGGMNWKTYSKGNRKDPINNTLKPLCQQLGLTNSKGEASCDQLQAYIEIDDVNFPIDSQTGKKKTISAYLNSVNGVLELIEILKKILSQITKEHSGPAKRNHDKAIEILKKIKETDEDKDETEDSTSENVAKAGGRFNLY